MSIAHEIRIRDLEAQALLLTEKLDKLAESVKLLAAAVSHIERHPAGKSGVRLPPTALPETLEKLEIGRQPEGM